MDKKSDYGRTGFTAYQLQDLRIVMSLKTSEDIQDWMMSVGPDDVRYGISLVEVAAQTLLDQETEDMQEFPDAMAVIQKIKHSM